MMRTTVVLFTRDLRVHDHPALDAAVRTGGPVVPLFVVDRTLLAGRHASPNRVSFLVESLHDLRLALAQRGAELVVRDGDPVAETMRVVAAAGADRVHLSGDVSAYAKRRERRLREACARTGVQLATFPGITVVPASDLRTTTAAHYRVFTPYWRAWRRHPWRPPVAAPTSIDAPVTPVAPGQIPIAESLIGGPRSPRRPRGGETLGSERLQDWLDAGVATHSATHDDLLGNGTSRLSPYLHLGCVSPLEVARAAGEQDDDSFLRQLCWRDFLHQVTDAFPAIASCDYRPRGHRWRSPPGALAAWIDGCTGVAVVDAAMHQLREEGWLPNRARLIAAAYLVRTLGIDWRAGADHFMRWLVDGDIANNYGNWQWVAGTGNDTRPNRGFSVERQTERFDGDGAYRRRYARAAELDDTVPVHP